MSLRILADENIPAVEAYVGDLGTVQRCPGRALCAEQLAGVDVLLVRSVTRVDAALLADSRVRFVGTATSGVDHIDRDYLARRDIGFSHAPGSNANSVVEYVLAAIAAVGGHLERLLAGGRVGIVGYGVIGKAVAARLRALDISCSVYDPWLEPAAIEGPAALAAILACDVITLHPELTLEQPWPSYHLLDEDALAQLHPDSLLINASRGPVVDNAALLALLERGRGPDVVLDVWEHEPAIDAALLRRVQLGTPHIAGYSQDGKLLATRMLVTAMASQLGLAWCEPTAVTAPAAPLQVPAAESAAACLRELLAQRYDIGADDAALREVSRVADSAAAGFDRLRREYPQRRELSGSRVSPGPLTAGTRHLLAGLGCVLPAAAAR